MGGLTGVVHHVELWVEDLASADEEWGWLLGRLGYVCADRWPDGVSYQLGATYVVLESGPDLAAGRHDRVRAGLNHLAFHAGSPADVDELVAAAGSHGWTLLFPDRHPHAGGPQSYAAYLEDSGGFEVELVAATG